MNLQHHLEHLRSLDDEALLRSLKRHVGSECRLNALVLAHLAEVDARGAYRQWACDTLAAYCVYELRLSEDEAQRRCRAARVARQFPVLFDMLAEASIHLTGILLLAPHLTAENHRELLARARYRRKREIERLVAELAPARDVPAMVEPLGPALGERARVSNTWATLVESHAGSVRHLERGDSRTQAPSAPDDWHQALIAQLEEASSDERARDAAAAPARPTADDARATHDTAAAPARPTTDNERSTNDDAAAPARPTTRDAMNVAAAENDSDEPATTGSGPHVVKTAPHDAPAVPHPSRALRYKVQFTADQAYVDLLERARDLLWHQLPNGDLAELQRLALEALVDKLMRRKCGAPARATEGAAQPDEATRDQGSAPARATGSEQSAPDVTQEHAEQPPLDTVAPARATSSAAAPARATSSAPPREAPVAREAPMPTRSSPASPPADVARYLPTAVRREVWQRDGGRCTFRDTRGVRCRATRALEFHHEQPFARGGPPWVDNITLRCRAHNELAAEHDFGRELVQALKRRCSAV